jgi:beta-aspartyl-peptidase (threonine type)
MKNILFQLLAILTCAGTISAQTPDASPQIRQLLQEQQAAWNRQDLEGFMSGYWNSPALTFFSGARVTSGWQATLEHYRQVYQSRGHEMGKLEFGDLQIEMLGPEAAFVRGAFHLTMSDGRTPHGVFTLVLKKFPEGWRIVHDHSAAADGP